MGDQRLYHVRLCARRSFVLRRIEESIMTTKFVSHQGLTYFAVRRTLVDTLSLDSVGPDSDHPCAEELLPESPTWWHLSGHLVPTGVPIEQRFDETSIA